ncbi:MAG: phosphoribosylformylglycinamidine cyclo-ligase [Clostridiales bacterium]|nr:phosphoribosylformylglycinamidine cyclo-ligase [Clostridiales bacterium]
MNSAEMTYKGAGVDTAEGAKAVELMKPHVIRTFNENVLAGLGSFGGLFKLDASGMKEPVLVSGTDGVGTKLKIAFLMDKHDTVGIDCVAMCVNDVLCQGARPLFFLDYLATGRLKAEKAAEIVKGVSDGCVMAGSALIGGETAEMPGFYSEGEYDIAGFSVGIVDKEKIITGDRIKEGDRIIGIASSGLHSNGFSLVREIFFNKLGFGVHDYIEELNATLGEVLLTPTRIYANACRAVLQKYEVYGIVHVTGGGFYENVPRVLPGGLCAEIDASTWKRPPVFSFIQKHGSISETEMFKTFNMGIGMMLFVDAGDAGGVLETLEHEGETAHAIGIVARGEGVSLNTAE